MVLYMLLNIIIASTKIMNAFMNITNLKIINVYIYFHILIIYLNTLNYDEFTMANITER